MYRYHHRLGLEFIALEHITFDQSGFLGQKKQDNCHCHSAVHGGIHWKTLKQPTHSRDESLRVAQFVSDSWGHDYGQNSPFKDVVLIIMQIMESKQKTSE